MYRTHPDPSLPDRGIKKKSLRASTYKGLLKIEGFSGKFHGDGSPASTPAVSAAPAPAGRTGVPADSRKPGLEVKGIRPVSSFKIHDSIRQIKSEQVRTGLQAPGHKPSGPQVRTGSPAPVAEVQREPLEEGKVVAAIKRYIEVYRPEQTVGLALETHRPAVSGDGITVMVDNSLQLEKLEEMKQHFTQSLRKQLKNDLLSCHFKIFVSGDTDEKEHLYTSEEKLEHFIKINPAVARLKDVFGLQLS